MKGKRPNREQWAAARLYWETHPRVTCRDVSDEFMGGMVTPQGVWKRLKHEGWEKVADPERLASLAHSTADRRTTVEPERLEVAPDPLDPHNRVIEIVSRYRAEREASVDAEKAEVAKIALRNMAEEQKRKEDLAVAIRSEVLEKHRKELEAGRALVYEGMRDRDRDKLMSARIALDALRLLQEGERKAYNLESAASVFKVIVERGGAHVGG